MISSSAVVAVILMTCCVALSSGTAGHVMTVKDFLAEFAKNPAGTLHHNGLRGAVVKFTDDGKEVPFGRFSGLSLFLFCVTC